MDTAKNLARLGEIRPAVGGVGSWGGLSWSELGAAWRSSRALQCGCAQGLFVDFSPWWGLICPTGPLGGVAVSKALWGSDALLGPECVAAKLPVTLCPRQCAAARHVAPG